MQSIYPHRRRLGTAHATTLKSGKTLQDNSALQKKPKTYRECFYPARVVPQPSASAFVSRRSSRCTVHEREPSMRVGPKFTRQPLSSPFQRSSAESGLMDPIMTTADTLHVSSVSHAAEDSGRRYRSEFRTQEGPGVSYVQKESPHAAVSVSGFPPVSVTDASGIVWDETTSTPRAWRSPSPIRLQGSRAKRQNARQMEAPSPQGRKSRLEQLAEFSGYEVELSNARSSSPDIVAVELMDTEEVHSHHTPVVATALSDELTCLGASMISRETTHEIRSSSGTNSPTTQTKIKEIKSWHPTRSHGRYVLDPFLFLDLTDPEKYVQHVNFTGEPPLYW